ncbi:MAG: anthranilate phosphoribosyltransferase [Puniceicoccales bacterium]|jgi:anthranilate phosphoribosyltransferase|nr:anthranilate phosphoribosyltransferase [Puniceicoccales bacterium]
MQIEIPWGKLTEKIETGASLDEVEATQAALWLADANGDFDGKKRFLRSLNRKGESVSEVFAFAKTFRDLARHAVGVDVPATAIDIVGTGGDKSGTFNISSAASILVSAAGVPVVKHGNRSITSESGSADFLSCVGVPLEVPDAVLARSLRELNYCFFYAPAFHPTYKAFMPVRKALAAEGHKTVFNILGPLINPVAPPMCLLGVFSAYWVDLLAAVLGKLGVKRGLVCHCALREGGGLDELATAGLNRVCGVGELAHVRGEWLPEDFGLDVRPREELLGGTPDENCTLFGELLAGRAPKGLRDTVVFNAAAAFWASGRTPSVRDGVQLARDLLESGAVRRHADALRDFYAQDSGRA